VSPPYQIPTAYPTDPFTVGLASILIWGYAGPASGMFAGNIAILRHLFQRMLHLGSRHSKQVDTPCGIDRSHPYRHLDFELGTVTDNKNTTLTSIQIRGGCESISSDTESQKQIVEMSERLLEGNREGIVVSQQVEIGRS
jgi:hypothetical protein